MKKSDTKTKDLQTRKIEILDGEDLRDVVGGPVDGEEAGG